MKSSPSLQEDALQGQHASMLLNHPSLHCQVQAASDVWSCLVLVAPVMKALCGTAHMAMHPFSLLLALEHNSGNSRQGGPHPSGHRGLQVKGTVQGDMSQGEHTEDTASSSKLCTTALCLSQVML